MSWMRSFSAKRTRVEQRQAKRMFLTMFSQGFKPVSPSLFWSGFCVMMAANVVSEVAAQPTRERGISRAMRMVAYFRVPGLTTPHRNWKR